MSVLLRLASPSDAPVVQAIYAPIVAHTATSFELEAPSVEEVARRIGATLQAYPWLVYERDGLVVGYAYAGTHRSRPAYQWSVETSVYVAEGERRGGVARALYTSLLALLRVQGYASAYAGITLPNPASVGFHEAMGFAPIGVYPRAGFKLGQWHATYWLYYALSEGDAPPPSIRTPDDLAGGAAWRAALPGGADTGGTRPRPRNLA